MSNIMVAQIAGVVALFCVIAAGVGIRDAAKIAVELAVAALATAILLGWITPWT